MARIRMNGASLREVRDLAVDLMEQHGVGDWSFRFDTARARFGQCNPSRRLITLSLHLVMMNPIRKSRNMILHEIAHALTPGHHHDAVWRAKAIEIGCNGKRCYGSEVRTPGDNLYVATCPNCGRIESRVQYRKPNSCACGPCCRLHNDDQFSAAFLLEWRKAESGDVGVWA